MKEAILVVGATGTFGEPVARRLHEDGYAVRVLSRNVENAKARLGDSFDYFEGDVEDPSSLMDAVDGCFGVHINLRGGPRAEDFERIEFGGVANVAKISAGKGVQRIAYLSGAATFEENAWFPMVKAKLQAEEAIRESGVPYTIFCATHFMESLSLAVRGRRATIVGRQPHRLHWLASRDYARMVSGAFQRPEAANKRLFIQGPDSFTMPEAIKTYCSIVHPDIKVSSVPIWLLQLIGKVSFSPELQAVAALMRFFEKVGEGGDPSEANDLLGAPTTTLEQWCEEQRKIA